MGSLYIDDPAPRNAALEQFGQPSLGSGLGLGATAEESWIRSPFSPLRHQEQMEAAAGTAMPDTGPVLTTDDFAAPPRGAPPPLSAEEATRLYGIKGELSFDRPTRRAEAELLNRWKRDELRRMNILQRATPGFWPGAARLGTAFLMQAVDPLNVASAFIPVVGEARFAALLAKVGRTPARLLRGGTEGAAGAVVVEPFVYLQARSERADYDAYDSLLNIAFGAGLGGGLHAGFGKVSDLIARQPIEIRETALRGAVAAVVEDRPVAVGPVIARGYERPADPFRAAVETPSAPEAILPTHLEEVLTPKFRYTEGGVGTLTGYIRKFGGIKDADGDLKAMNADRRIGIINRKGRSIDELGEAMMQDGFDVRSDANPDTWDVNKVKELIRRDLAGEKVYALGDEGRFVEDQQARLADEERAHERAIAISANERAKELLGRDLTTDELRGVMSRFFRDKYEEVADAVTDELEGAVIRDMETAEAIILGRTATNDDLPFDFEDIATLQRQSQELQPTDAQQIAAIDRLSEGYDQPITPETGAEEAADLIEATNEAVAMAKREGVLTEADEAAIKGEPEAEKLLKNRAKGIEAAASCLGRVA